MKGKLDGYEAQLTAMVEQYPDATLLEYCEYWGTTYDRWLSTSTMCRALQKQKLTLKKRRYKENCLKKINLTVTTDPPLLP